MVVGVQTKEIKQVQLGIWQKYSRNILMGFNLGPVFDSLF
jgi:hypothetical protein